MLLDGNDGDEAGAAAEVNSALADAREETQQTAPEIAPPEPPKEVSIAPKPSRRERAEKKINEDFAALANSVKELREGLSQRDRQIGELTGALSSLAQRPAYQPPPQYQAPQPAIPDPEELERKAQEAIDRKDFTGYQRYTREASVAATMRALGPVLAQRQAAPVQQQEQVPAGLMPYFAAYPEVASHPSAMQLLAAKNVELEARGFARGPERVKKIFDEVKATLTAGRDAGAPSFSQASAGALSGVPTARPTAGSQARNGEMRVQLTPEEQRMFKALGQSEAEMAKIIAESHPERIIR